MPAGLIGPTELALRRGDSGWLLEAELKQRFAGDFDLLAAREHLHCSSGAGPDACANGRALTTAGDGADDRSQGRAAADFLRGVLAASFALQRVIAAHHRIVTTIDTQAGELQLQCRATGDMARFFGLGQASVDVRALASHQDSVHSQVSFNAGV